MQDELLWGAAWLHKATKNHSYINYIQINGKTLGVQINRKTLGADENINEFGWDNKHAGINVLVSKVSGIYITYIRVGSIRLLRQHP